MNTPTVKNEMGISGKVKIIAYKAGTKEILRETEYQPNLIMLGTYTGKSLILANLVGDVTHTDVINYGALGTSSTTPSTADTKLGAEVARTVLSLGTVSSNVATLQFFFPDANLTNGTYNEFGAFVDASATANSGQIFNHILFGTPYTKTSGEDTTVQLLITIS